MNERPKDPAWEALVEVTGANVSQERGALNRALAGIRLQTSELDVSGDELALMIRHQGNLYREVFPEMPLTCSALAKWWGKLDAEAERLRALAVAKADALEEKRKTKGANLRAENNCTTCCGNAWVVVGYRKPVQTVWMEEHKIEVPEHRNDRGHEETAPCPVCNAGCSEMPNYWDGRSWNYGPAPGELVVT